MNVQRLSKLELGPGTFEGDFVVGFTCEKEPCKPTPHIQNGEMKGKPELLVNEPLHKLYRIKAELSADIDLGAFPFDEHVLMIQIGDRDALDVTLKPDTKALSAKDEVSLPGWEVTGIAHHIVTEDLGGGLKEQAFSYEMTVRRPRVAAIAKNLLPALTMVLVLFISLVMKPKMAAPRLAAGTGSFVAVIMFHNTAAGQLPPLGFLTLLDKFMFSLYVLWILHIAFSIGILRADEAKNEEGALKLYKVAFGVLPAVAAVSWALVLLRVI